MTKDSHGKGRAKEQASMEEYRVLGCEVWQPKRSPAYEGNTDIFGVGDFIVWSPVNGVYMVQVCHRASAARHRRAIDQWNETHPDFECYLETYK